MLSFRSFLALSCTAALLTGCLSEHPVMREDAAKRTAMPVFMIPRDINADTFRLQAYERVYQKYAPATVYIEGDGSVDTMTAGIIGGSPTPTDPVALRLAAQDGGQNVIWLARPCQYNKGWKEGKNCPPAYATTHRFAPEVIDSYNKALDDIKAMYGIPQFNLVGYDGSAAIATMLTSQRSDIASLRTVAGNLAPKTTAIIAQKPLGEGSLNPLDFAAGVANIPQRHFLGKSDFITPPAVYNSFAQAVGNGQCLNVTLVDKADHTLGWAEQWKVLKDLPLDCAHPPEPEPVRFDPTPLDGDKGKVKRMK